MCTSCMNKYHLSNMKWGTGEYGTPGGQVYWSFATGPGAIYDFDGYITNQTYKSIIRDAFQAWEDVADIDFVEVADGALTDIHLGLNRIDGPFGIVGTASSEGSKTTSKLFSFTAADIQFDQDENWATTRDVARSEVGLFQVALHEIGHAIGLDHSDDPTSIMYARDISDLSGLSARDIAAVQGFYGAARKSTPVTPVSQDAVSREAPPEEVFPPYITTPGNDIFVARPGNDVINGGGGIDTLRLTGDQSQYTLTLTAGNMILIDRVAGRDGTDTLISIERLEFGSGAPNVGNGLLDMDALGAITTLNAQQLEPIIELYIAYFNRAPDAVGLAFWGNSFAKGVGMQEMAMMFIDQDETRAAYPDTMSNAAFATAVYNNVLGRQPDAEGFAFWVDLLNRGRLGRDTFILEVLGGAKVAPLPGASASHIANLARDKQYLADKTDIGAYFAVHKGMSDLQDAAQAMALFNGSHSSITAAVAAIDSHYQDALSAANGDFLMPLVGVLEDPFTA